MKKLIIGSLLLGVFVSKSFAIVSNNAVVQYDPQNPIQCPGRFLVNQTDTKAGVSVKGKKFYIPANIYVDMSKNLMWMACPVGSILSTDKKHCTIDTTTEYDWATSLNKAQELNDATDHASNKGLVYTDWHIPTLKELRSLYRHPACRVAVIYDVNQQKYDATNRNNYYNIYSLPSVDSNTTEYWSSTLVGADNSKAWSVDLESGVVQQRDITTPLKIILVRKITGL